MSAFEEYLDKYCKSYNVDKEVALTHKTVLDVKAYYEKEGADEARKLNTR